jgi:tRNA A37 methylthiotransferase MiaB
MGEEITIKKICVYASDVCRKRSLDASKIRDYLIKNNYDISYNPKDADIIIFVTCGVADRTTEASLKKIKEFQQYRGELIVAGCLPAIEKGKLSEIFNGKTISTKDLDDLDQFFPKNKVKIKNIDDSNLLYDFVYDDIIYAGVRRILTKLRLLSWVDNAYLDVQNYVLRDLLGEQSPLYEALTKDHYHVRVSWGCLGDCAYCGIKKAIGTHKSKPLNECIQEFKKGLKQGYKYFTLTSDDTGAYGTDIKSGFPELLDKLTRIPGEFKITVTDLHPVWVVKYVDELEEIIKRGKIDILDIPLQSGNERVLKLMNRYSDVNRMRESILRLKNAFPDLSLTTQNIAGFPTEKEDEFEQTLEFIKEIDFNGGLIYPFSIKTDTKAEKMEPKIPPTEIIDRLKYAKKYLKSNGYIVTYRSLITPPKLYRCLAFMRHN